MPLPREEALRIGKALHYKDAVERIKTGNHKDGDPETRQEDTDMMLILMLEQGDIEAIILPDGELCFYEVERQGPKLVDS